MPYEADRLLERRIVLAHGHLDGERASELSARLVTLDAIGDESITLHLRTEDADLPAAFAVADTIGILRAPVHVLAAGAVGGPALLVLAAARRREITAHAVLRLSEPRAEFDGRAADVAVQEAEYRRLADAFYLRLAEVTGREVDDIRDDARRGRVLTARDALAYGLVQDIPGTPPPGL